MNLYQRVWDGGYGRRYRRVMSSNAPYNRKMAALMRVWNRMIQLDSRHAPGY